MNERMSRICFAVEKKRKTKRRKRIWILTTATNCYCGKNDVSTKKMKYVRMKQEINK